MAIHISSYILTQSYVSFWTNRCIAGNGFIIHPPLATNLSAFTVFHQLHCIVCCPFFPSFLSSFPSSTFFLSPPHPDYRTSSAMATGQLWTPPSLAPIPPSSARTENPSARTISSIASITSGRRCSAPRTRMLSLWILISVAWLAGVCKEPVGILRLWRGLRKAGGEGRLGFSGWMMGLYS